MEEKNIINEYEESISIVDILYIIKKRLLWIILSIVLCFSVAVGYTFLFKSPTYVSTGTMIVAYEGANNENLSTQYNYASLVSGTYVSFINDIVMDEVAKDSELTKSYLKSNISVTSSNLFLIVRFSSDNADCSKEVVNQVMDKAMEIADSLDESGKPKYKFLNDNLKVIVSPETGVRVSTTMRDLVIGLVVGVVLAGIVVFMFEIFDRSFRSHEEIERALNLPVLAIVPYYEFNKEKEEETINEIPQKS